MFPVYAGMNRNVRRSNQKDEDVPRVRGDEPTMTRSQIERELCSPCTRG